jgi:hypothetical protein
LNKLIFTILTLGFISCTKQSGNIEANDVQNSDTVVKIKILNFEKSKAVIFPANYWKKPQFAAFKYARKTSFFTPDEETVRYIETQLPKTGSIMYSMWQNDSKIKAKNMELYDKQYYGYIDDKKDSVIAVRVFNFLDPESDHAKKNFDTEVNLWACGWYNFNACDFLYSLKLKKFRDFK